MRADEVARQPVSEPLAARLLALVEQWREQATSKQRDGYTMPARSRARLALFSAADMKQACADELAAALRRLPHISAGQEAHRIEMLERQYDRLALCPDHRDKATGRCIVCQAEERTAQELRRLPPQLLEHEEDAARGDKGTLPEGLDLPQRKEGLSER